MAGPTPTQAAHSQSGKKWQPAALLSPGGHPPLRRPTASVGQSGSPLCCSALEAPTPIMRQTVRVGKTGSPPRCSALEDPRPLRRPPTRVGQSGSLPPRSALGGPPLGRPMAQVSKVKVAARRAAQPRGPHSGCRLCKWQPLWLGSALHLQKPLELGLCSIYYTESSTKCSSKNPCKRRPSYSAVSLLEGTTIPIPLGFFVWFFLIPLCC